MVGRHRRPADDHRRRPGRPELRCLAVVRVLVRRARLDLRVPARRRRLGRLHVPESTSGLATAAIRSGYGRPTPPGNVDATPATHTWTFDATPPGGGLADPGQFLRGTVALSASPSDTGVGIQSVDVPGLPRERGHLVADRRGHDESVRRRLGHYRARRRRLRPADRRHRQRVQLEPVRGRRGSHRRQHGPGRDDDRSRRLPARHRLPDGRRHRRRLGRRHGRLPALARRCRLLDGRRRLVEHDRGRRRALRPAGRRHRQRGQFGDLGGGDRSTCRQHEAESQRVHSLRRLHARFRLLARRSWQARTLPESSGQRSTAAPHPRPASSGDTITYTQSFSPGPHMLAGELEDLAGNRQPIRVHFTTWSGATANYPYVEKNSFASSAMSLRSTSDTTTVTVPAGAWTGAPAGDWLVLRIDPQAASGGSGGFEPASEVLDITAYWALSGGDVTSFSLPLEIEVDNTAGPRHPRSAPERRLARRSPRCPAAGLPAGWDDGFAYDGSNIRILTRHLSVFTLLVDAEAPSVPGNSREPSRRRTASRLLASLDACHRQLRRRLRLPGLRQRHAREDRRRHEALGPDGGVQAHRQALLPGRCRGCGGQRRREVEGAQGRPQARQAVARRGEGVPQEARLQGRRRSPTASRPGAGGQGHQRECHRPPARRVEDRPERLQGTGRRRPPRHADDDPSHLRARPRTRPRASPSTPAQTAPPPPATTSAPTTTEPTPILEQSFAPRRGRVLPFTQQQAESFSEIRHELGFGLLAAAFSIAAAAVLRARRPAAAPPAGGDDQMLLWDARIIQAIRRFLHLS